MMAKAKPVPPVVEEPAGDALPGAEELAGPLPPAPPIPVVAQPQEPVGLPTGNPWDLAYPLGHAPPTLKRTGGDNTDDGPGFIGAQVDTTPNDAYTAAGMTAAATQEV